MERAERYIMESRESKHTAAQLRYVIDHFLHVLSFVPDDKLSWKPSETSKSALELGAHVAFVLERHMELITSGNAEELPLPELLKRLKEAEASVRTRPDAVSLLESGKKKALEGLALLPASRLDETTVFFGKEIPVRMMLIILVNHVWIHAGQLEYLQTIWGDLQPRYL